MMNVRYIRPLEKSSVLAVFTFRRVAKLRRLGAAKIGGIVKSSDLGTKQCCDRSEQKFFVPILVTLWSGVCIIVANEVNKNV